MWWRKYSDIDVDFIDDTEYNESVENYYAFENVSREYDDVIADSFAGFDFSQEPSNYCSDDKICNEVTELKVSKKKVEELNKTLLNPEGDKNVDSFFLCNFICNQVRFNRKVWSMWEWQLVTKRYQIGWNFWNLFTEGKQGDLILAYLLLKINVIKLMT